MAYQLFTYKYKTSSIRKNLNYSYMSLTSSYPSLIRINYLLASTRILFIIFTLLYEFSIHAAKLNVLRFSAFGISLIITTYFHFYTLSAKSHDPLLHVICLGSSGIWCIHKINANFAYDLLTYLNTTSIEQIR